MRHFEKPADRDGETGQDLGNRQLIIWPEHPVIIGCEDLSTSMFVVKNDDGGNARIEVFHDFGKHLWPLVPFDWTSTTNFGTSGPYDRDNGPRGKRLKL